MALRLSAQEIENKAQLQVENPNYVNEVYGLSDNDKSRIIQRAAIIRRQNEAVARHQRRQGRGGKKRLTRKGRKIRKGKGTKKARKTKRKTQSKRKVPKKARKTMRSRC